MQIPKSAHPRPERVRKNWKSLNGEWEFSFDTSTYDRKITVPFSWVSPLSGIEENVKGTGYYRLRTSFDARGERAFLIVGACDYETEVTVNGILLCTHKGGYSPIEVDVSRVWSDVGENVIEIKATDLDLDYTQRGKQSYGECRGIWQTVYMESRPKVYLDSFVIRTHTDGNITIDCKTAGGDGKITAEFEDMRGECEHGRISMHTDSPRLWSVEDPYLYRGVVRVESEYGTDEVETYFGIREIGSARFEAGGEMYVTLNGKPVYINSALDQSFNLQGHFTLPSNEEEEKEILRLKRIGLNGVRIHIKTEEPRKLYYADLHGLLVMQDIPCHLSEPNEKARENFEREMAAAIMRDINHPSIIQWIVFNETWGLKTEITDSDGSKKQKYLPETAEWVRKCYHTAKALDPTRIVEDNSPCIRDHVETDVNTWHSYKNGYENVKSELDEFCRKTYVGSSFNYAHGYKCTDVPVMNSECGNVWGVKGTSGDSDLAWHYKYMLNEYRLHEKICGFVFTEFHDVINEFNGYYRINNIPKIYGYDGYVPEMSLCDLHSDDFLACDLAPMTTVEGGGCVSVPLYISSFTDKNHSKQMFTKWELVKTDCTGDITIIEQGEREIRYDRYGKTKLFDLSVSLPNENGVYTLRLYLCDGENTVMRNFALFDVVKAPENTLYVPLTEIKSEGFSYTDICQMGAKLNLIGSGKASFTLKKSELPVGDDGVSIIFEASAREKYRRDELPDKNDLPEIDCVRSNSIDRGLNPNSFAMTDEEYYSATLGVEVCGVYKEFFLPDCPADSRGCLSHHYQKQSDRLDEAGSYGYICRVDIPKSALDGAGREITVTLSCEEGFSLFDRKSGRYPVGVWVMKK